MRWQSLRPNTGQYDGDNHMGRVSAHCSACDVALVVGARTKPWPLLKEASTRVDPENVELKLRRKLIIIRVSTRRSCTGLPILNCGIYHHFDNARQGLVAFPSLCVAISSIQHPLPQSSSIWLVTRISSSPPAGPRLDSN